MKTIPVKHKINAHKQYHMALAFADAVTGNCETSGVLSRLMPMWVPLDSPTYQSRFSFEIEKTDGQMMLVVFDLSDNPARILLYENAGVQWWRATETVKLECEYVPAPGATLGSPEQEAVLEDMSRLVDLLVTALDAEV